MLDFILTNPTLTIFAQLFLAMLFGMSLGLERSIAGKTTGMRTYALVSMGAALFVVVSVIVAETYLGRTTLDPLRVAASVVSGIGFIGAGIIIFRETSLRGVTTAAGLWMSAAIGVAIGFGLYVIAFFATLLTLFVFTSLWFVETKIKKLSNTQFSRVDKDDDF